MNEENITKLTDDQVEILNNTMNEVIDENEDLTLLNKLVNEEVIPENLKGKEAIATISIDPNTGEEKIIDTSDVDSQEKELTFEEMCDKLSSDEFTFDTNNDPVSEEEINKCINESDENSIFNSLFKNNDDLDAYTIQKLLEVVNKRMNNEKFNVYRAFPEKIQNLIDANLAEVVKENGISILSNQAKQYRNMISEALLEEFVNNINMERMQKDFNKEIETIFKKGTDEIANSIVDYTEERTKAYREYAEKMEDQEKKQKLLEILDSIDESYNLTGLKEFCKKFKVRRIDLEKVTDSGCYAIDLFLKKYEKSQYNIYSLYSAEKAIIRHIGNDYYVEDVRAFTLAFCSYCANYDVNNVVEHSFMYYVLYNMVLTDINTGDKKEVSDKFLDNIRECINNIKERNKNRF